MSVWYVICIILPCNQEYTLCGGPRGCRCPMTRRHPMSASALRLAVPLHSLSYRCVAVRIHCTSALGTAIASLVYSFPPPVAACPFRLTSRRGPSHISYPSRFSALQHAAFPFHLAALPVLPVVPYLRIWVARSVLFGDLLPLEAALATVAPLEQTAQCAVVQPFAHGLRVLGVHHEDAELKHGTGWDGLGCGRAPRARRRRSWREAGARSDRTRHPRGAGTGFCAAPRTRCRR